jgi:hypothetical protein
VRRAWLAALLASGCASYSGARGPAPASASTASTYSAQGSVREPAASVSGATVRSTAVLPGLQMQPLTPSIAPPGGPDFAQDEEARREEALARWEAELDRARDELAATVGQCRVICMAATNVCAATREICRLTGDATAARAHDARCARARERCLDAARRRDGACPACPAA